MKRRGFFAGLFATATAAVTPAAVRKMSLPDGTIHCNDPIAPYVDIIDTDTGKRVNLVKSANVSEGWVERYITDADGRIMVFPCDVQWAVVNGEPVCKWGNSDVQTEILRGRYHLRLKA